VAELGVTYRLILLFFCIVNIYFFGLYNASELKGNPIKIIIMFGLAEVLGILFGDQVIQIIAKGNSKVAMLSALLIITLTSSCIKILDLSEGTLLVLFLVEIFFIGNAYNCVFTV